MFRMRMIRKILRQAQLAPVSMAYAVVFFGTALIISFMSSDVGGFGNAVWLCFQTATTIGFGDTCTQGIVERILLVALSVLSVFYVAIITGVVVAYVTEMVKAHNKGSLARIVDDLENLEGKTPDELREISERARSFRLK